MFAQATEGRERRAAGTSLPRHRHGAPYAALVLRGGYEECGSAGRFRVREGDVLLHGAFDAHLDRFAAPAEILNLPLAAPHAAMARVADLDRIARLAERDPREAAAALREDLRPAVPAAADWPDLLAAELLRDTDCRLEAWAARHGLAQATVSRGFARVFGVSPSAFRAEARARRAFARVAATAEPLAAIAAALGFADQAHMTRAVAALTGAPPGRWRSNGFKTALH